MKLKPFLSFAFLLLILFDASIAQWSSIGNIEGLKKNNHGITLSVKPAIIEISILAPDVFRIRMSKDGYFLPDSSWAVIEKTLGDQTFNVHETDKAVFIVTVKLTLKIKRSPCRFEFYDMQGSLINQDDPSKGMAWSGNEICVWKTMPADEYYFGLGEKAGALQKKGKSYSMWNTDIPAYKADTDPLYQTIPFFYGINKGRTYGIFFDNTYYSYFNMGKENPGQYSFGALDGELNYYFIYGPKPNEVQEKFSKLIGTMPIPPKWAIGYQQCRWSYYPESKIREIATNFRTKQIPCDAIYLDIHYMDGYRCFTWDNERFPDPKRMVSDLAEDGFKMVVIIDPGIKNDSTYRVYREGIDGNHFVKYPDGKYFTGTVWPGECVFPDFTGKATREWWGSLYKDLIDIGVKGFWNDMNEPSVFNGPNKTFMLDVIHDDNGLRTDHRKNHNIYGMQMARGTYEGLHKLQPNERPFVLTRANYAGGNRYAAAWTGDNISSWEHLEMAVPMCLNLSISGQPFVGTDIGGFVGSPSGELYTRWLQFGIFSPLMRTHTEINSNNQEPWSFGAEYEAINKKSIELRYKLLPYIYTQFYQSSKSGIPIMRPIFFDFPNDQETYWNDKEFLFGDAFLVAPVLWEGQTKRDIRFPAGDWYDYWTGDKFTGPNYLRFDAPINRIPLFVKAGSIITTQQVVQYTDMAPIDPLTLDIYPSADTNASAIFYEDDGKSYEYLKGNYFLRSIRLMNTSDGYKIVLEKPEGNYHPPNRSVIVKLHDITSQPSYVRIGKLNVNNDDAGWIYDKMNKILAVRLDDKFREQIVIVGK